MILLLPLIVVVLTGISFGFRDSAEAIWNTLTPGATTESS